MRKTLGCIVAAGVLVMGAYAVSFAMNCGTDMNATAAASASSTQAVNAGNTVCPVTGETIDKASKATYTYEGKIYNLCCAMCIDDFKKDPQKYIKKVKEELQAEPKNEAQEETTRGDQMREGS